jgi:hypothetical protein
MHNIHNNMYTFHYPSSEDVMVAHVTTSGVKVYMDSSKVTETTTITMVNVFAQFPDDEIELIDVRSDGINAKFATYLRPSQQYIEQSLAIGRFYAKHNIKVDFSVQVDTYLTTGQINDDGFNQMSLIDNVNDALRVLKHFQRADGTVAALIHPLDEYWCFYRIFYNSEEFFQMKGDKICLNQQ